MINQTIVLPSKPKVIKEELFKGVYEIDGLYPGYGHTLGNSLRRIILSSLPGSAIISLKIDGVDHEFSTISGVKEDVIAMILNIKKVRMNITTDEPQILKIKTSGVKTITSADIEAPGQVEIINKDQYIATLTDKSSNLDIEMVARKGLGYVPKEVISKEKSDVGDIVLDAAFTPIRRVSYEVENMRVGDRTDFNKIIMFIETDGSITPRQALEDSVKIMIDQLRAIVGIEESEEETISQEDIEKEKKSIDSDLLKTRIDTLDLSSRTLNALSNSNIRTLGGLTKKNLEDLSAIEGMGSKSVDEVVEVLGDLGLELKK